MTSARIVRDTSRNHTQVFLRFRNSYLEIYLNLIYLNFTLDLLPSIMLSSGARTSNEIPLRKSGLALPAILITFPFSFSEISNLLHKLIQFCLINCPPIFRWLRVIRTCSMWNQPQTNLVHSGTTR